MPQIFMVLLLIAQQVRSFSRQLSEPARVSLYVSLLFASSVARALDQIMRFSREWVSWLPAWVFDWDIGWPSTFDAVHIYMGITLIGFGVAFLFTPAATGRIPKWLFVAVSIVLYYQVFNLFYHVIFIKPEFWRWPIFNFDD